MQSRYYVILFVCNYFSNYCLARFLTVFNTKIKKLLFFSHVCMVVYELNVKTHVGINIYFVRNTHVLHRRNIVC